MRPYPLSAVKAGITRLRSKGGASPESLYDLLNGKVTAQRTIVIREGSVIDAVLPAGTKGLCAFNGQLVFFANQVETAPAGYACQVIVHPTDADAVLEDIHFAEPYAGALYVVAEFDNGDIFHYWLESSRTWAASTVYFADQIVLPTTENGLAYKATRLGEAYPAWAAGVPRVVGDRVEPSTYTGYYYEVVDTNGTNPISGDTEPTWPTSEGAQVIESVDAAPVTITTPTTPGDPGVGIGDNPYCLVETAWLDADTQVRECRAGTLADLHRPEHGFYRDACLGTERAFVPCVRLVTATAVLEVSRTTPVNHADAIEDLVHGTWSWAADLLGRMVLVEDTVEEVLDVQDIGGQWVVKASFGGASVAATSVRGGRRIYTHNARIEK